MYYKPHTLYKRVDTTTRDEYGRILANTEEWLELGLCRCDDNTQQEFRTENGAFFMPKYHIVAEGSVDVHAGDEVRCLTDTGMVRGEGRVYQSKHLNKLQYTDLWV